MTTPVREKGSRFRLAGRPDLHLHWLRSMASGVEHQAVLDAVHAEGGWSLRYGFLTVMSAGIAVLGLLLSSPAVVIGAMLVSPLMNPILGLGFALATLDFKEMRRSILALVSGSLLAVAFSALIVVASPLKEATAEILSRTRPNLFDLLVALFAALAGAFALIRGHSGTVVGVAIATALMPPLGVVGYGLATSNIPVLAGAAALFGANFVMIALAAAVMARLYGFGYSLSSHQGWLQTGLVAVVFVLLAIPLGLSLDRIASEALQQTEIRGFLTDQFGSASRLTQVAVDFDAHPITVRAVVITPRSVDRSTSRLQADLAKTLGRPVSLQLDRVLMAQNSNSLEAQRARLQSAEEAAVTTKRATDRAAGAVALAAGIKLDAVVMDADRKVATANFAVLPGADLETYYTLEARAAAESPDWRIAITPPFQPLPTLTFATGSIAVDAATRQAIILSAWAAKRWNVAMMGVPGLPKPGAVPPKHVSIAQGRALAIAAILNVEGLSAAPDPARGRRFRLSLRGGATQ